MVFPRRPCAANGHGPQFHFNNGFFERVDAEIAYALVRQRKPQRVIEIGSGNTTLVNAAAMRKNAAEGFPGELFAIEPYPAPYLKQGLPGLTRLIPVKVQDAPFDLFLSLRAGDILFIDSSHVVSMDSDVLYELLGILPKLAPGVLIHFHDIFSPLDYPEKFVKRNLCFWGEQYMLEAFLSFNSAFKVVWAGSAMQRFHPEVLREAFPGWEGSFSRMPSDLKVVRALSRWQKCLALQLLDHSNRLKNLHSCLQANAAMRSLLAGGSKRQLARHRDAS